jgi:uncharacterized membrane protein
MQSKAAIGGHPIHPMLVPIPIGAFFLAFVGDVMHMAIPEDRFWYDFSYTCIGIGILFAVVAAAAGAIDYLGVPMSATAFRTATTHAVLNVILVILYLVSFLLRRNSAAVADRRWPAALAFSLLGLATLAVSGWLGGKLAYEHRVGVREPAAFAPTGTKRERAAS